MMTDGTLIEAESTTFSPKDITDRVKSMRKAKGLSQSAFGELIGSSKESIAAAEQYRANYTLEQLYHIRQVFDCSWQLLMEGKSSQVYSQEAELLYLKQMHEAYLPKREPQDLLSTDDTLRLEVAHLKAINAEKERRIQAVTRVADEKDRHIETLQQMVEILKNGVK
jgi:transcriptional regulator with XRE-family HTH domain